MADVGLVMINATLGILVWGLLASFLILGVAHVRNIADAYRLNRLIMNLRNEGIASIMSLARLKQVRTYLTCSWLVDRSSSKHLYLSLRNGILGLRLVGMEFF